MEQSSILLPYPAEKLIPHRPPMLLVRQLLERHENSALADAVVPDSALFFDENYGILPELYIEFIAQATATVSGWDALQGNRVPGGGFLVGLNKIEYIGKMKPAETVEIDLTQSFSFGDVTIWDGVVRDLDNRLIVKGEIKVWEDSSG